LRIGFAHKSQCHFLFQTIKDIIDVVALGFPATFPPQEIYVFIWFSVTSLIGAVADEDHLRSIALQKGYSDFCCTQNLSYRPKRQQSVLTFWHKPDEFFSSIASFLFIQMVLSSSILIAYFLLSTYRVVAHAVSVFSLGSD
jgi:hypothetical protein